jgi:four helix bundle protein
MKVFQDTGEFVCKIHESTSNQKFNKDFVFREQVQRAAFSIMPNISEGYERNSDKELIGFL